MKIDVKRLVKSLLIAIGIIVGVFIVIYAITKLAWAYPLLALLIVGFISIAVITCAIYNAIR